MYNVDCVNFVGDAVEFLESVCWDILLVVLFVLQHSGMALNWWKSNITIFRYFGIERMVYVCATCCGLLVITWNYFKSVKSFGHIPISDERQCTYGHPVYSITRICKLFADVSTVLGRRQHQPAVVHRRVGTLLSVAFSNDSTRSLLVYDLRSNLLHGRD